MKIDASNPEPMRKASSLSLMYIGLWLFFALILSSCRTIYYRVESSEDIPNEQSKINGIDEFIDNSNYYQNPSYTIFIVHTADTFVQILDVEVNLDGSDVEPFITGAFTDVDSMGHATYLKMGHNGRGKLIKSEARAKYLNQVHIFVNELNLDYLDVSIAEEQLECFEIYHFKVGRGSPHYSQEDILLDLLLAIPLEFLFVSPPAEEEPE